VSDSFLSLLVQAARRRYAPTWTPPFRPAAQDAPRDADLVFRVSMLGPTKVGKTSIIAALLREAETSLLHMGVALEPFDLPTEQRIAEHRRAIAGLLYAGEFDPAAIRANIEEAVFRLRMSTGSAEVGIRFDLLDYPGGWLDPHRRGAENQEGWDECLRFMEQSTTLVIPVDAAVIMEAQLTRQKMSLPFILAPSEVRDIAARWAAARMQRAEEPAMVVFAPIKCESYFDDNGGLQNESGRLYQLVTRLYDEVREVIRLEAPHAKVFYAPVDTLGCVQLISARWLPNPVFPDVLECLPHFGIRPPGRVQPKGVDSVLFLICQQLAEARKRAAELILKARQEEADQASALAGRREGLLKEFLMRLTGEQELREEYRSKTSALVGVEIDKINKLNGVIDQLAARPLGARARQW
jgi:hypothetical protein